MGLINSNFKNSFFLQKIILSLQINLQSKHIERVNQLNLVFSSTDSANQLRFDVDRVIGQISVRILFPSRSSRQLPSFGDGRDRKDHGLDLRQHRRRRRGVRRKGDRLVRRSGKKTRNLHRRLAQD